MSVCLSACGMASFSFIFQLRGSENLLSAPLRRFQKFYLRFPSFGRGFHRLLHKSLALRTACRFRFRFVFATRNSWHFESETGMPQYDPVARKVYVNLQDENIFAVIDPATGQVVGRYPVGRCKENHGMTLDLEHHRAFLSCEGNEIMTVFDLDKHHPIVYLPMAPGPDVMKFDPGRNRIYVACYGGAISVFQMDDPDRYRKLEDFPVPKKVQPRGRPRNAPRVRPRARGRWPGRRAHGRLRSRRSLDQERAALSPL
jgi:hypothetical protein